VNLYLRLLKVLLLLPFVRRRGLLEANRLTFRVWPNDCDLNLHLNNGRYLTFMDLGRLHLIARRWMPVLSAAEMNFIRPLRPLQKFDLVTRLLSWDEKYFYIEQRFEAGGKLHAIGMVKGLFLHGRAHVESRAVTAMLGLDTPAPDMPEALRHWIALGELKKHQRGTP
jgi:acyl-CoA thioesterase FadM